MAKSTTQFVCQECGAVHMKWAGKCDACGGWNTIVEENIQSADAPKSVNLKGGRKIDFVDLYGVPENAFRLKSNIAELDRVCGNGLVAGSVILVGGDPGIGKSTLLLQTVAKLSAGVNKAGSPTRCVYISGEESVDQIRLRASRLKLDRAKVDLASAMNVRDILVSLDTTPAPDVVVIDSIQTMFVDTIDSAPGTVGQVRACANELIRMAKRKGFILFLVGHVTKEGQVAGPRVLEHMVDTVLYFEGESSQNYRILRAVKNRFGSTNEIGVFEMGEEGLSEVANPSAMLLEGRPQGACGTCVACVMEGTRPILAEVQALVTKTSFNVPRRTSDGFDFNRAALLLAVAEKKAGMRMSTFDAYINIIGGLKLDEPASDLPVLLAVASSYREQPIADDLVAIGEIGLTGEIRAVSNMSQRLNEIARLGFTKCIIPRSGSDKYDIPNSLTVYRVNNLREAIEIAL